MSKKISQNQIQQLRDKYSSDNHVKVVRNAMIKTNSNELSMDWEKYRKIDHHFPMLFQEKCQPPIKNQAVDAGDLQVSIFLGFTLVENIILKIFSSHKAILCFGIS